MSNEFQEIMLQEFEKFLKVYNNLTNSNVSLKNLDYSTTIRILGNFIYKDLDINDWQNSHITFSKNIIISLNVFKDTQYENSVKNFLVSLKNAFYSDIDEDVYNYLNSGVFNEVEKELCTHFYEKVKDLNSGMKHSIFDDKNTKILENDTISTYADKLKAFNDFVYNISTNQEMFNIITRFDKEIKNIAKNKKHPRIFFDV
jgi:hypothetical protein